MPLLHISPRRILGRFVAGPLPPTGSFDNKTVLITGGTAGLGLAAAVHFASLGANIIITYQDTSRGEVAKRHVEERVGIADQGRVTMMHLDLNRYASCTTFIDKLKERYAGSGGLDVVILNAGRINPQFEKSPEGWEETLQVNALSTILLGLLFSTWMMQERDKRKTLAHLVFVSSRDHMYPDITHWAEWAKQEGILHHLNSRKNWPPWWATTEPNYDNSKLLLMYAVDEIVKQTLAPNGEPQVIVNSVDPGVVRSQIGRSILSFSWLMKIAVPVYLGLLGKSPDNGARSYIAASLKPKEEHGRLYMGWLTDEQYRKKAARNMTSEMAKNVQTLVWGEIINELASKVDILREHVVGVGRL